MTISFKKYHGTGNDFILIDDRQESFDITQQQLIKEMCSRRFGVGADGLILLRNEDGYDFKMVYFNADGRLSTMCGNGGRCLVKFAHSLDLFDKECRFIAVDGPHEASVLENGEVKLKMIDVNSISKDNKAFVLDTGSPHYVKEVKSVEAVDIAKEGADIRYSKTYKEKGINVNFIEFEENGIIVATYERGVEDETFSCGTGVTAAGLVANSIETKKYNSPIRILTKGGRLMVYFKRDSEHSYSDIWLQGPAVMTYSGTWTI